MSAFPLLPLDHKGLTRAEAADFLRGLADLIEAYPTVGVVLSVSVEAAAPGSLMSKFRKKHPHAHRFSCRRAPL